MEDSLRNAKSIILDGEEQLLEAPESAADILIKCSSGYVVVSLGNDAEMLKAGDETTIEFRPESTGEIRLAGHGECLVNMGVERAGESEIYDPEIPEGRTGMKDFRLAMKLALGGNPTKASPRRSRFNETHWCMPALERKLIFLNKSFIPLIAWLLGIIGCAALMKTAISSTQVFIAMVTFSIVYVILIMPLIFLAFLPKPLTAYVKKVEDLTPEERRVFEKRASQNIQLEKMSLRKWGTGNEGPVSKLTKRK